MGGAESVHHIDVAQRRHALGQRLVVFLFALVEAHVLAQHHLAVFQVDAVEPVLRQRHLLAQQPAEVLGHRLQRVLFFVLALGGPAQVREQHDARARFHGVADGRQRGADAGVAGDLAVFHRHVEIFADQHPFTLQVQVGHAFEVHRLATSLMITGHRPVPPPSRAGGWRSPIRCRTRPPLAPFRPAPASAWRQRWRIRPGD